MAIQKPISNLTITNPHLDKACIFWKGEEIPNIEKLLINNNKDSDGLVIIKLLKDPAFSTIYTEMESVGITIKGIK